MAVSIIFSDDTWIGDGETPCFPLTAVNQKVYNMRRQMSEGADISALDEVFPCIPHGRVA